MPDAGARALSVTRSPAGRRSSPASPRLSLAPGDEDVESGSVYHDPLDAAVFSELQMDDGTEVDPHGDADDEEDADGAALAERFVNGLRAPVSSLTRSSSHERIAAKQWWFEVILQFRTHLEHLNYLAQERPPGAAALKPVQGSTTRDSENQPTRRAPRNAHEQDHADPPDHTNPSDPTANHNDITNEDTFLGLTTGYHAYLCHIKRQHPEAATPLWHAFRSLGGRWTADRRGGVRDEGFLITVPSGEAGEPERWRVDLTQESELWAFRQRLATPRRADDSTLRALVIPDLSPLFIELVGGLLHIDHRVFTNHLWSEHRRPFLIPNRHALEVRADAADPPNTVTLDVDTHAVTYVQGGASIGPADKAQIRTRLLNVFRQSPLFFPFLDRAFDPWPASLTTSPDTMCELATSFRATSRATVHWIAQSTSPVQVLILLTPSSGWASEGSTEYTYQGIDHTVHCRDDNDSFLYTAEPRVASLTAAPPVSEADQYCTDIERLMQGAQTTGYEPVHLEAICLSYLASKFLASTQRHLQADNRRLNAFRLTYDPVARRKTGSLGAAASAYAATEPDAEAAHDPLRDLQYLRDRVARRQQNAATLMQRVGHAAVHAPPSSQLADLHAKFPVQLAALAQLQESIAHAQSDIASSLQRRLTLLQLEEARKSIAQGAMVRKLTILAFVFVPVSATASAFGMNVAPLLADPPPVWAFAVAAVALTFLLVVLAMFEGLASVVRGLRDAQRRSSAAVKKGKRQAKGGGGGRGGERGGGGREGGGGRGGRNRGLEVLHTTLALPLAALGIAAEAFHLMLLPVELGLLVLRHVSAEGAAARERDRRDAAALVRNRFAFREPPWKIWLGAWSRRWTEGWRKGSGRR